MPHHQESRKIRAQFLNGLAVSVISAGALVPAAGGLASPGYAIIAVVIGAAIHGIAIWLSR